jgi:hypothetical protein
MQCYLVAGGIMPIYAPKGINRLFSLPWPPPTLQKKRLSPLQLPLPLQLQLPPLVAAVPVPVPQSQSARSNIGNIVQRNKSATITPDFSFTDISSDGFSGTTKVPPPTLHTIPPCLILLSSRNPPHPALSYIIVSVA